MEDNCIFCKIAQGIIPSKFVYETDNIFVVNDINPKAETHLLVITKEHYSDLNCLEDRELMSDLFLAVKAVTKKLGIKDYRTIINTGKGAGQEVFHIHIHVLAGKMNTPLV